MKKLAYLLFIVLLFAACAKTVESESKNWESNKTRVAELKGLYPGLSAALDAEMARAQSLWDAAASVSNEEDKIAKMAEANAVIGSGWVGDLGSVDGKIRKLRSDAAGLSSKAGNPGDKMAASNTTSQVNMTISRIEQDLRMASGDAIAASAVVTRASSDLKSAQKMVDDMEKIFRDNKKGGSKTVTNGTPAAGEPEKVETNWKCGYCQRINDKAALECTGCGASKQ